jgi:hypothetical protein
MAKDILAAIAEERIREAMERGEFDNLPGAGKPIHLDDDTMVPADLRVAYRILRNAGCLPPELELRKEIVTLRDLIRAVEDDGERREKVRELNRKVMRLSIMLKRPVNIEDFPEYRDRVLEKIRR